MSDNTYGLRSSQWMDKRTNERGDDGPKIVICPTEANDDEELPLIPPHTNLLNLEKHISVSGLS